MNKKTLSRILAVLLVLAIWQAAAMAVGIEILLVSPWTVAVRLFHLIFERDFWPTVFFSILRISAGFFLGLLLGTLLAVLSGRSSLMETLLWPYVTGIKSVPVASFIIISLIWLKNSQLAVFISFLMVFPVIYSNVLQGIKTPIPPSWRWHPFTAFPGNGSFSISTFPPSVPTCCRPHPYPWG